MATGCAANPSFSTGRARLLGTFFSTGNATPGSFVGDVIAQIGLRHSSDPGLAAGSLQVVANVDMCTDSGCSQSLPIGSATLGTATVGQDVLLQMEWDRTNKRFDFKRDGVTTGQIAYTQSDLAAPGRPLMAVGTRLNAASCASGPRTTVMVDARIDNVAVNRSATR